MNRRRLSSAMPRFDFDDTLRVLRDNLGRADAFITTAEDLFERPWSEEDGYEDESGDSMVRRRNHVAHLIESAKLAVRAAIYTGDQLDVHRRDA